MHVRSKPRQLRGATDSKSRYLCLSAHLAHRPQVSGIVDDDVRVRQAALLPLVDVDVVVGAHALAAHQQVYALHKVFEHLAAHGLEGPRDGVGLVTVGRAGVDASEEVLGAVGSKGDEENVVGAKLCAGCELVVELRLVEAWTCIQVLCQDCKLYVKRLDMLSACSSLFNMCTCA